MPVYTKFYFFNVLNPKEVENGSTPEVQENPAFSWALKAGNIIVFFGFLIRFSRQVEELGPFTYNEYRSIMKRPQ